MFSATCSVFPRLDRSETRLEGDWDCRLGICLWDCQAAWLRLLLKGRLLSPADEEEVCILIAEHSIFMLWDTLHRVHWDTVDRPFSGHTPAACPSSIQIQHIPRINLLCDSASNRSNCLHSDIRCPGIWQCLHWSDDRELFREGEDWRLGGLFLRDGRW